MKIYLECHEESSGNTRTIKQFILDHKIYLIDECIAGGVDIQGETKGFQNFVCMIGKRRFFIYCEEKYCDGKLNQKYFVIKGEKR